jgi:hypothetical protein
MPSLLPRILSWGRLLLTGWWSPVVAGVTPVLCLCRSCWGQAAFGDTAVGGILSSSSSSSSPQWSRQPAASAAGPLARAGLSYLTPWKLLGCQPTDCAALGIPLKSSPRQCSYKLLFEFLALTKGASGTMSKANDYKTFIGTCTTICLSNSL